jgi:hypothetical protein
VNRSEFIARLVRIFADEGRERWRRWGLVQGRRVIQEIDELLAVLRRRQREVQDQASDSYDGWLPVQDRYTGGEG